MPIIILLEDSIFCCLAVLAPSGPLCFISSSHQKWLKAGAWEGDKASSLSWHDLKLRISFFPSWMPCCQCFLATDGIPVGYMLSFTVSCWSIFDVPKFTLRNILGCCSDRWTKSAKRVLKVAGGQSAQGSWQSRFQGLTTVFSMILLEVK